MAKPDFTPLNVSNMFPGVIVMYERTSIDRKKERKKPDQDFWVATMV